MFAPVITGVGIVSCAGVGMSAHGKAFATTRRATAATVADPFAQVRHPLYALACDESRPLDLPASELARLATDEALRDAELCAELVDAGRVRVIMASSVADASSTETARTSGRKLPPSDFALLDALRERDDLTGRAGYELSNACAGSGYAIAIGCDLIASGKADVVIAGGAESYSRVTIAAFNAMSALSKSGVSRPFDRNRDGVVLGEGAAVVILESAEHARSRRAQAYAMVSGSGWSCDAYHPIAPDPSGTQITRAMREAIQRAGVTAPDIGCVIPHGTGTVHNDVIESRSLAAVFDGTAGAVPLYSLKASIGHLAGGSAAASVAVAAVGLRDGRLPGNVPVEDLDPACTVAVPTRPISLGARSVMVNAYAAGGNNISLILGPAA